jgi:hypothetical protein
MLEGVLEGPFTLVMTTKEIAKHLIVCAAVGLFAVAIPLAILGRLVEMVAR